MHYNKMKTFCSWSILLGLLFILVFGPVFYGAVMDWQIGVLTIAAMVLLLSWILVKMSDSRRRLEEITGDSLRLRTLLVLLPVLFLVYVLFQVVSLPAALLGFISPERNEINVLCGVTGGSPISASPYTTYLWFFRVLSCAVVFFVTAFALNRRNHIMLIISVVVILGYILSFYGLLQYLSNEGLPSLFKRRFSRGKVSGTYVNSSHFAGYLEMIIPLAIAIVFIGKRKRGGSNSTAGRRIITFLSEKLEDKKLLLPLTAAIVMSVAMIFTLSRMGIFSFLVSLLVFGFLLGKTYKKGIRIAVFGAIVAVVLAISIWLGLNPLLDKYSLVTEGVSGRLGAWKMAGSIIADYSATGTGLGTFTHVSPGYQSLEMSGGHWGEAHNDYLNLFSDAGVPGIVFGLGFIVLWYLYVFKLLKRRSLRTYQRSIAAGCIAGVTAMLVHSIADFNLQIPANALYFSALLGLSISVLRIREKTHVSILEKTSSNNRNERSKAQKALQGFRLAVIPGIGILLVALITISVITTMSAQYYLGKALISVDNRVKKKFLKKSLELDTGNPEIYYYGALQNSKDGPDYLADLSEFSKAVEISPYNGKYHYRLGITHARLSNDQLSEKEFSLASKLAPMHPDLQYKMGYFHFYKWRRTGDSSLIQKAFSEFRIAAEVNISFLERSIAAVEKYITKYEHIRKLVPDIPEAHFIFANFLARKARWKEALEEYRTTWRMKAARDISYGGDELLVISLARSYLMTGKLSDARRGYLKAVKNSINAGRLIKAIRDDYAKAGREAEGLELLEYLRKASPGNEILEFEIAKTQVSLGKYDEAEQMLLSLCSVRPFEEAYLLLYKIAMRRNEYGLAQIYIDRAIDMASSSAQYYVLLSAAKKADGDLKGAAEALKKAISLDPSNKSYLEELREINRRILFKDN